MLTRILTAAIGVVVFFTALALPPIVFPFIIFAVTVIMLSEMYSVLKCGAYVNIIGYISAAAAFLTMYKGGDVWAVFLAATVFVYVLSVIIRHGKVSSKDILSHGFVTLYIAVSMSFVALTNTKFTSIGLLWIFIIAWLTDSGAYFTGVFLGKHKLCPHISPKKTVEGSVGGVLTSGVAGAVYYFLLTELIKPELEVSYPVLAILVGICLVGSVLAQLGDFAASCIKRDYNVKDYGSILPGHGGLMDRFDSVIFVAPFVYYCLTLMN